ncbi:MAG TPA: hypothetical protein VE974_05745 [Thermoanaerobaculia bacterium]|nr:hypothetical protein [Thermoanaerobaculia bacterium]
MTFINWSDPEEMLTLLVEYVSDELSQAAHDRGRTEFLTDLLEELAALENDFGALSPDASIAALRSIHEAQPGEFLADPVLVHVEACIEELARINA